MSMKLRTIFAISFAFLILIFCAILSSAISSRTTSVLKGEAGNLLYGAAFQMADKLDYFMWSRYSEVDVLSELLTQKQHAGDYSDEHLLDQLKKRIPSFSWVGITDDKGVVTAATGRILANKDISERPVFKNAVKKPYIGDVHDAVLLSKLLPNPNGEPLQFVDISTPIRDSQNRFKGVLAAHLSWTWSREVRDDIIRPMQGKRKGIEIFVISSKDHIILLGPKNMVGKPLNLARGNGHNWAAVTWPDGKKYVTGFAKSKGYKNYSGLGWSVIVRQPEAAAYAQAKELQRFIIFLGAASSVIFALLSWAVAGRISKPLQSLTTAANMVSAGNSTDIPVMKGIKDIEILSASLREMVLSLSQKETQLGEMEMLAYHDGLTGLPNRISLLLYMDKLKKEQDLKGHVLTFLFFDLDGFKAVNDSYGHHTGDLLIKQAAVRIRKTLRYGDFLCRLGGDEFVAVIEHEQKQPREKAGQMAEEVISVLNRPFLIEGQVIHIGCSIGGAIWPLDGKDPEEVLKLADQALYAAKANGRNRFYFSGRELAE